MTTNPLIAVSVCLHHLEDHLDFLVRHKFPVELAVVERSLSLLEDPRLFDKIADWRAAGIEFFSLHNSLTIYLDSRDPEVLGLAYARLHQMAGVARALGAKFLSHHSGRINPSAFRAELDRAWLAGARSYLARAHADGIWDGLELCLENQFEDDLEPMRSLCEEFGVRILFDVEHWHAIARKTTPVVETAILEQYHDLIGYMHFCDHTSEGGHQPLGTGSIDWPSVCAKIPNGAPIVLELMNEEFSVRDNWLSSAVYLERCLGASR